MSEQIKVLIVDDSSLIRKIVSDILEKDPDIKVIGTANDGKAAILMNNELNPDVITLDIEMPILDGLSALKLIMSTNPKPVIMMSALTQHGADATFKALELGAVDFIPKKSTHVSLSIEDLGVLLITKVKAAAKSRLNAYKLGTDINRTNLINTETKPVISEVSDKIVAIGTSTGGPSALINIFNKFPEKFPSPVVVVQHMPEGFTGAFSDRLNHNSNLEVKEAKDGDELLSGHGYVAPGHSHMGVEKKGDKFKLKVFKAPKVSGHMPSIDVLFDSVAEYAGSKSVGVILTGMGRDGAAGLLKIKSKGGYTIAQNEETSIVYGMNKVAVEIGAVNEIVPLWQITDRIVKHI
ncbi:MAG: chemotaxis response regulator protein-glutamate methylesterase [Spirochaetes bacterium]|nr:chemotaxis response regulator protein-glutamate methylesterase [Spirochaetota bacterium]